MFLEIISWSKYSDDFGKPKKICRWSIYAFLQRIGRAISSEEEEEDSGYITWNIVWDKYQEHRQS